MKAEPQTLKAAAPLKLWHEAQRLVQVAFALFGQPLALARAIAVSRAEYQRIASWLRCCETLVRHLLLIEAAAMPIEPAPAAKRAKAHARKAAAAPFDPETPEAWRVNFRCIAAAKPATPRRARRGHAPAVLATKGLALRLQAILRVFDRPVDYAQRLARWLRRFPRRVHELLRAPPEAKHRIDHFALLQSCAESAAAPYNSS